MDIPPPPVATTSELLKLMNYDYLSRQPEAIRPLFTLEDVLSSPKDDLERYARVEAPCCRKLSFDNIKQRFFEKYPMFNAVDFRNILVAGGSVSNLVTMRGGDNSDIDIFLYGLTAETARLKIGRLIEHFELYFTNANLPYIIIQTPTLIRFIISTSRTRSRRRRVKCTEIQIIPRLYTDVSEILYGFDLGSAAVGFDGRQIHFSMMGRYSYTNMCNVIDSSRRSTSYAYRLCKYYYRGFSILIPMVSVACEEQCDLNLKDGYAKPLTRTKSDYNSVNLSFTKVLSYIYDPECCVVDNNFIITLFSGQINKFKCEMLSLHQLIKILGDRTADLLDTYTKYLQNPDDSTIQNALEQWNQLIIENTVTKMTDYPRFSEKCLENIQWISQNPGTQLTSSMNPIICDLEQCREWYGPENFLEDVYHFVYNSCLPAPSAPPFDSNSEGPHQSEADGR